MIGQMEKILLQMAIAMRGSNISRGYKGGRVATDGL
jgi:hypothetical protein